MVAWNDRFSLQITNICFNWNELILSLNYNNLKKMWKKHCIQELTIYRNQNEIIFEYIEMDTPAKDNGCFEALTNRQSN